MHFFAWLCMNRAHRQDFAGFCMFWVFLSNIVHIVCISCINLCKKSLQNLCCDLFANQLQDWMWLNWWMACQDLGKDVAHVCFDAMSIALVSACETASLQTIQVLRCGGSMQVTAEIPSNALWEGRQWRCAAWCWNAGYGCCGWRFGQNMCGSGSKRCILSQAGAADFAREETCGWCFQKICNRDWVGPISFSWILSSGCCRKFGFSRFSWQEPGVEVADQVFASWPADKLW